MDSVDVFEAIHVSFRKFVKDRDWGQYHTPRNLSLALCGETGELAECFQWKGDDVQSSSFSQQELTHIGEEASDVFLYTMRLADVVGISVSGGVRRVVSDAQRDTQVSVVQPFTEQSLHQLIFGAPTSTWQNMRPRDILFKVIRSASNCIAHFDSEHVDKVKSLWPYIVVNSSREITVSFLSTCQDSLQLSVGRVAISLLALTQSLGIPFWEAVRRKMKLNAQKYPANVCRGSSAKYTQLQRPIQLIRRRLPLTVLSVALITGIAYVMRRKSKQ